MINILLTGGSGFLGKNIQESYLNSKYHVLAPRHSELELLDEVCIREYIGDNKISLIIHSAGMPGHRNSTHTGSLFYTNTRIFFNLARNLDICGKMINLGSGAVYDMRNYLPKMKEEYFDVHVPDDEHGLCKYVCSKYIQKTKNIVDLRIFGIFGKYEDYSIRFISNAICKSLFDLPITIKQNRKFDYLYVDDLIPVLEYFIDNEWEYSEYNVTPRDSIELNVLAQKVKKISGKDLPIVILKNGMGSEYSGSNSRLEKEVKNLVYADIDIAIADLYNWYNHNKQTINRELLLVDK